LRHSFSQMQMAAGSTSREPRAMEPQRPRMCFEWIQLRLQARALGKLKHVRALHLTGINGLWYDLRMRLQPYALIHCCPRLSQYDCCLPIPCIHAQTMQHCQHPHTASNLSNLTWAGQQIATLCLWYICQHLKSLNLTVACNLSGFHQETKQRTTAHCRSITDHEEKTNFISLWQ
jgi:hypothetical protein